MGLGGNTDEVLRGKLRDIDNINNKPTNTNDMYEVVQDLNMMHRRVVDEYPVYAKDGSYSRAIEDPGMSPQKASREYELNARTSLVNQASSMKAKNNANYI